MIEIWIALAGGTSAAVASIAAAIISGFNVRSTKRSEIQAESMGNLENRLSEKKHSVYEPMITLLGEMFTPDNREKPKQGETIREMSKFATWISIYGSDPAMDAFRKFTQAVYNGPPPTPIMMRLYADFIIEARRDMGYSDTSISPTDLLSVRITDIYTSNYSHIDIPFDQLCEREKWTPPWPENNRVIPK